MPKTSKNKPDPVREERIIMEVVVDAHGPEERSMGWYYYLAETIQFPFSATCIKKLSTSPVKPGASVEVVGMADGDDCEHDMLVKIAWEDDDTLSIPLIQIEAADEVDEETQEAIADWHYWVNRGYRFGV